MARYVSAFIIIPYALLAIALTIHVHTVVAATPACTPGTYSYNESGSYVCLPPVKAENYPFLAFSAELNGTSLYLRVACVDPRGCNITFWANSPDGKTLFKGAVSLNASNTYAWKIALPETYNYVVLNMTVNEYEIGPYAIPSVSTRHPVISITSMDTRAAIVFLAAVAAPPIALVLRHNPKESGIALVLLSFLYTPLMFVFGIPFPIPEIVASIMFVLGVFLIATTRS